MNFDAQGVQSRFVLPATHINTEQVTDGDAPFEIFGPVATLEGLAVLVVEDQLMIAMDTELVLRRLGAREVRLAPHVDEALASLAEFTPDVAVLDFNLGAQTCEPVADALRRRGIAFVFATGYGEGAMIPERLRHVPVVPKPIGAKAIAAKITLAWTGGA